MKSIMYFYKIKEEMDLIIQDKQIKNKHFIKVIMKFIIKCNVVIHKETGAYNIIYNDVESFNNDVSCVDLSNDDYLLEVLKKLVPFKILFIKYGCNDNAELDQLDISHINFILYNRKTYYLYLPLDLMEFLSDLNININIY